MTIDAKLTLDLERFVLGSGYCLHVKVDPPPPVVDPTKTDPPELQKSLLVRLRTITQPEVFARVCARTDLAGYREKLLAPLVPFEFYLVRLSAPEIQAAMGSIVVGDDIIINPIPELWAHSPNPGAPSPFTARVWVTGGLGTDYVLADVEFPTYAKDVSFQITEHLVPGNVRASGIDGEVYRHNPAGEMYCRVWEDYTLFEDLTEAINKLESCRAEARGLVKDYERSGTEFEGDTEETFT